MLPDTTFENVDSDVSAHLWVVFATARRLGSGEARIWSDFGVFAKVAECYFLGSF